MTGRHWLALILLLGASYLLGNILPVAPLEPPTSPQVEPEPCPGCLDCPELGPLLESVKAQCEPCLEYECLPEVIHHEKQDNCCPVCHPNGCD